MIKYICTDDCYFRNVLYIKGDIVEFEEKPSNPHFDYLEGQEELIDAYSMLD